MGIEYSRRAATLLDANDQLSLEAGRLAHIAFQKKRFVKPFLVYGTWESGDRPTVAA